LTRAQVREVDRIAIEDYGLPGVVLMENAARGAADVAMQMLPQPGSVLIFCGAGNNGGDGLAIGRHLSNRNYDVRIILAADPAKLRGDAQINFRVIQAMKLPIIPAKEFLESSSRGDLLIDALFGTGLTRAIEGDAATLIGWMNASPAPTLAIDLPSGLDADTGEPTGPCVRADRTVTFVAEKKGFENPTAVEYLGDVTVVDIGAPRAIVDQVLARR
jgi:NAD(P)H-hydrate epimerase